MCVRLALNIDTSNSNVLSYDNMISIYVVRKPKSETRGGQSRTGINKARYIVKKYGYVVETR